MRILHLVEPAAGEDPLIACRAALGIESIEQRVWLIADSQSERFGAAMGVVSTDRVAPPLGIPELAARGLRRLADDRSPWSPHLVHCWSIGALAAARLAIPHLPRTASLLSRPTPAQFRQPVATRLRFALGGGIQAPTVLTPDHASARAWTAAGARDARACPPPLDPPPAAADRAATRAGLLRRLGLNGDDGDPPWTLVALLGDPPCEADARQFVFVLGLLYTTGQRLAGIVPRRAGAIRRAGRFVRAHGRRWGLLEHDGPMESAATACDLAVLASPTGGGSALAARCARAGVPVVADNSPVARWLIGPASSACLVERRGPTAFSATLLPLVEDLDSRLAAARTLQQHADRLAAAADFQTTLEQVWRETIRMPAFQPMPVASSPALLGRGLVGGAR